MSVYAQYRHFETPHAFHSALEAELLVSLLEVRRDRRRASGRRLCGHVWRIVNELLTDHYDYGGTELLPLEAGVRNGHCPSSRSSPASIAKSGRQDENRETLRTERPGTFGELGSCVLRDSRYIQDIHRRQLRVALCGRVTCERPLRVRSGSCEKKPVDTM